jgi:hypothetical protein
MQGDSELGYKRPGVVSIISGAGSVQGVSDFLMVLSQRI